MNDTPPLSSFATAPVPRDLVESLADVSKALDAQVHSWPSLSGHLLLTLSIAGGHVAAIVHDRENRGFFAGTLRRDSSLGLVPGAQLPAFLDFLANAFGEPFVLDSTHAIAS